MPSLIDCLVSGAGTLAGRYLRRFWQPIYRAQDLAPGACVSLSVLGEALTLWRDAAGRPCLGTPVMPATTSAHGPDQPCADNARWPVGAAPPAAGAPPHGNGAYPTAEYLGHIFAYLGDLPPPPPRRFPDLEGPGVLDARPPETWPCNYFNQLDNLCDLSHVLWTHRESTRRGGKRLPRGIPTIDAEETAYGLRIGIAQAGGTPSSTHFVMPNASQAGQWAWNGWPTAADPRPWVGILVWVVPVDDTHATTFVVNRVHLTGAAADAYAAWQARDPWPSHAPLAAAGARVLAGQYRLSDLPDTLGAHPLFPTRGLFRIEDYLVQVGQGARPDRRADHLGATDRGVRLLRRLWQRELRALATGTPLTAWSTPALSLPAPA